MIKHRSCPPLKRVEPLALSVPTSNLSLHGQFGLTRSACEVALGASVPGVSFGSACRFLLFFKCVFAGLLGLGYQPVCTPLLQRVGWSSEPTKAHYLFFIFAHKASERAS